MAKTSKLKNVRFFQGLNPSQLQIIEIIGSYRDYNAGDTIFSQGNEGEHVYFIVSGRVEIVLYLADSTQKVPLHIATEGSVFGEFVLFEKVTRTATAVATRPTTIFAVKASTIKELFKSNPTIGYAAMSNLCNILVGRMKKTTSELRTSLMW